MYSDREPVPGAEQRSSGYTMRKKSHISLGNYLIKSMQIRTLEQHKKAFLLGSILPDCKPSFLTKRHEINETYDEVKEMMVELTEDWELFFNTPHVYWRRVGEVLHHVADYFTYPHNEGYEGSLKDHCMYEKWLKHYLKFYILSGKAWKNREAIQEFSCAEELFEYLETKHEEYMKSKHNVEGDVRYITIVCLQTLAGMYQLLSDRIRETGYQLVMAA